MTTRTTSTYRQTLWILTLAGVLLFAGPSAYAQSCDESLEELATTLAEIEALSADITTQRNRALALAERHRSERDECNGSRKEIDAIVAGLRVSARDYERTIARYEARPKPATWFGLGFATPIAITLIVGLVYLAAK